MSKLLIIIFCFGMSLVILANVHIVFKRLFSLLEHGVGVDF